MGLSVAQVLQKIVRRNKRSLRLGTALGVEDIRETYRRSFVGPLWLTLGLAAQVATIGVVFSFLFSVAIETYLPYLATSFVLWNLIVLTLNESSTAFIRAERLIKQLPLPPAAHVYRVIWKNLSVALHTGLVIPGVFVFFGFWPGWPILLAPLGLALIAINLTWMGTLIAVIATRFRDVKQMVQSFLTMVFYVTPVLWLPDAIPEPFRGLVLGFNPFYHLMELVRRPLLGETPEFLSVAVALSAAAIGIFIAARVLSRYQEKIPFWL